MKTLRHGRGPGKLVWGMVAALLFVAASSACEQRETRPTPTPAVETGTASPSPTSRQSASPTATLPPKVERSAMVPAGPLEAEPVRVYTGDGDCLNVRYTPGLQFDSDPRTCVPEGFLLWLYGDAVELDGYQWRYALGQGWVAEEFVQPDPDAELVLADRLAPVIVSTTDYVETYFAHVEPDGTTVPMTTTATQGANQSPELAPGGEWAAWTTWGSWPTTHFLRLGDSHEEAHAGHAFVGWSRDSKALLVTFPNCPTYCQAEKLAHAIPGSAPIEFATIPSGSWGYSWLPDGESIMVRAEGNSLYQYSIGGDTRTLIAPDQLDVDLGEITISPGGRRVMSSPFLGAIQLIDLESGQTQTFDRAPQNTNFGGRCGGASGKLAVWLDEETFVWHESYALKGSNGITIGSMRTGERQLVPFFTIQDVRRVESDLLSFTTWEYMQLNGSEVSFPLTWLLDVASGEARPVTVGSAPAWQVPGATSPPVSPYGGV